MSGDDSGQVQADDRRTPVERFIAQELEVAMAAMKEVASYLGADELPWTDTKMALLEYRVYSILADLDHVAARAGEQPPYPPKTPLLEAPPAEQVEAVKPI